MKQNNKVIAGMLMAVLFAAGLTYGTAFAQETDYTQETDVRELPHTLLIGTGAAVSQEDDHGYRSHFKLGLVQTSDQGNGEFEVKKGKFVVGGQDIRHVYEVIPETWEVKTDANKSEFKAEGMVVDEEENYFEIQLQGKQIRELQRGNLYYVTGEASDGEHEFDLFYISAMFDRTPRIEPLPTEISGE